MDKHYVKAEGTVDVNLGMPRAIYSSLLELESTRCLAVFKFAVPQHTRTLEVTELKHKEDGPQVLQFIDQLLRTDRYAIYPEVPIVATANSDIVLAHLFSHQVPKDPKDLVPILRILALNEEGCVVNNLRQADPSLFEPTLAQFVNRTNITY